MKRLVSIIALFAFSAILWAQPQGGRKFNPEQFKRDQEAFITKEARLTPQEAAVFFPVFHEMQGKQREIFNKQRECWSQNPQNDKEAAQLVTKMDELDMRLKKLQQQYHVKFCKVIPATKAYLCIKAEELFKHKVMEKLAHRMNKKK